MSSTASVNGRAVLNTASALATLPSQQVTSARTLTARISRTLGGAGPSMVFEVDVESFASKPPLRYVLQRRWRDLVALEAALVREQSLRGSLMLSTTRITSAEQRKIAANGFFLRLLGDGQPPKVCTRALVHRAHACC